jgi:streptogramin lyase
MNPSKALILAAAMPLVFPGAVGAQSQIYKWSTIAGVAGYVGSADATNRAIRFNAPWGVALDRGGNLYVGDSYNATIRKLAPEGTNWVSSTIAGKAGSPGSADGTNSTARFGSSGGSYFGQLAVDGDGNVFVADYLNQTIRKIMPVGTNWVTTTIAGLAGQAGSADGTNSAARFNLPNGVAPDSAGNLYVVDGSSAIRRLTPEGTNWVTTTIAGSAGHLGSADGANSAARFNEPIWVAVDSAGNVYVTDYSNHTIRKLTPEGTNWVTTTIAGKAGNTGSANGTNSAARFNGPTGVALDSAGNLYVADYYNNTIRKLTPAGTNWVTTTIGGLAGAGGSANGTNSAARFSGPSGVAVDSAGNVYVSDWSNNTIRMGVPLPVFQSVTPTNGGIELTWSAAPGQTFQLQYNSDLGSTTWTNLGSPVIATTGTMSATDTPGPDQHRFYRVIVQP